MKDASKKSCYSAIVDELGNFNQWVVYKRGKLLDSEYNRFQKIPFYPDTHTTLPTGLSVADCSDYGTAVQELETSYGEFEGIGFIVSSSDPYCFIDVDNCFDPETGKIKSWAEHLVQMFGSFTHKTPSGNGLRIIVRGSLKKNWAKAHWPFEGETHKLELVDHKAFQTFPHDFEDLYAYSSIEDRQGTLDELIASFVNNDPSAKNDFEANLSPDEVDLSPFTDNCPVRLSDYEMNVWNGDSHTSKENGGIDRSDSLFWIANLLYEKGASLGAIAAAIEERDTTLGWNKYVGNKKEYIRIAQKALNNQKAKSSDSNSFGDRILLGQYMRGEASKPEFLVKDMVPVGRSVHIFAPSGKGKSWLALWLTTVVINKGKKVLYLDKENVAQVLANRLRLLGVSDTDIDGSFDYRPSATTKVSSKNEKDYEAILDEVKPDLVVFDAWAKFLASGDMEENDSMAIAKWSSIYLDGARQRGISTVILDHTVKNGGTDNARGSGRKKEEVDVQFELQCKTPFSATSMSEIKLVARKDRESILPESLTFKVGGKGDDSFVFELKSIDTAGEEKPKKKLSFHDLTLAEQDAIKVLQIFETAGARKKEWIAAAEGKPSKATIDRVTKKFKQGELVKNILDYNEETSKYLTSVKPQTNQCRMPSGRIGAFDNLVSLDDFLVSEPDVAS